MSPVLVALHFQEFDFSALAGGARISFVALPRVRTGKTAGRKMREKILL